MSIDRRKFLAALSGTVAVSALGSVAHASSLKEAEARTPLATDPMRPQFHLLPAKNWMNDPNGPIYFNGKYHMFFQYNPLAAVWGDMSWNHAVSTDMLHWTHLPVAMTPTAGSPDSFGVFSGSAIQVGKRVYAVYTGARESTPELATIRDGENRIQESQCLAWSDDADLVNWTKAAQPVIPSPPDGLKITGFRDPSTWKQGDAYYMTVGSGIAREGGCVLLYRSRDLKTWEYMHTLTEGIWNGKLTPNPCDDGEMWECPEFFPLGDAHVLIYSTLGKVYWQSGMFNATTMKFKSMNTGLLDLGGFYAPKTQLDSQGRRILWGWIQERRSDAEMTAAGWSGMMSLPRVMSLDADGTLRLQVLPEAKALRLGEVLLQEPSPGPTPMSGPGPIANLRSACGEVLCSGVRGRGFAFSLSTASSELLIIKYLPEKHLFLADGREMTLQPDDLPTLHAFVDGSVIELIVGQRIGYTKRFYYPETTAPDVFARAQGGEVKMTAWKIAAISPNRLTTPAAG